MKLSQIRIENFRSFKDQTIIFDDYTCLVGANGAGKSAVLTALNVFFRNTASTTTNMVNLSEEDFHHRNTAQPIRITVTFVELPPEAQEDLSHYFRQNQLVVTATAVWDKETQSAEVKQCGQRLVMKAFAPYFEADGLGASAADLKITYAEIRKAFAELPAAATKPTMEKALRDYEESHLDKCELIEGSGQFYGWSKGSNLLAKYVQWVYVPAVKDATTEQEESNKTALGQLLQRTIRSKVSFKEPLSELKNRLETDYRAILDNQADALRELETSMQLRLHSWASPGAVLKLNWHCDPGKSISVNEPLARAQIGEDEFVGEVARLGHGMQRSFLVSLVHELAALDAEAGPTLILGFEEPELYQHPPQAQHMASVLEKMATTAASNSQVIVSTHSPYFVSTKGFESVRLVRKVFDHHCSRISHTTYHEVEERLATALCAKPQPRTALMARIEQIMQPSQRELYFSRVAVLVEGQEDVAFLATHLHVRGIYDDFRGLGCHFVVTGGKTCMSRPLAIAMELGIPTFVIFDGDGDDKNEAEKHARDNACLLRLCKLETFDPSAKTALWAHNVTMWGTNIMAAVRNDFADSWDAAVQKVRDTVGLPGGKHGIRQKNTVLIAAAIESLADNKEFSPSLDKVCKAIIDFAESVSKPTVNSGNKLIASPAEQKPTLATAKSK